jgi:hypothetical protein
MRYEPETKAQIDAVAVAVETYIPKHEAVVVDSRPEGIYVMVLWLGGTWMVGEIVWAKTT